MQSTLGGIEGVGLVALLVDDERADAIRNLATPIRPTELGGMCQLNHCDLLSGRSKQCRPRGKHDLLDALSENADTDGPVSSTSFGRTFRRTSARKGAVWSMARSMSMSFFLAER